MDIPMRHKYVDEAVRPWFIFGEDTATGRVDLSDGERDVFTNIPRELATRLIYEQGLFLDRLYEMLT